MLALVGAWFGFVWGAIPYDDGCHGALRGGGTEREVFEVDEGLFVESCTSTAPSGRVAKARLVFWLPWVTTLSAAAGGWFAGAWAFRTIPRRSAALSFAAAVVVFLLATALFFTGAIETGGPID